VALPGQRGRSLWTVLSVRNELADVIKKVRDEQMNPSRGKVLIYGLRTMIDVIKAAETEDLLRRVERRLGKDTEEGEEAEDAELERH